MTTVLLRHCSTNNAVTTCAIFSCVADYVEKFQRKLQLLVLIILISNRYVCSYIFFLGFDPWNESRKALADLIEEETVNNTENMKPPQHYINGGTTSLLMAPAEHPNCIPTPDELVRLPSLDIV